MIQKDKYYTDIIYAIELAGKYKKNNKRYYFNFYNFNDKKKYKLNSKDIFLAKNNINTWDLYKKYIRYKLFNEGYNNSNMRCETICYNEKYNNQDKIINLGYNSVTESNLEKYLQLNSNNSLKIYYTEAKLIAELMFLNNFIKNIMKHVIIFPILEIK